VTGSNSKAIRLYLDSRLSGISRENQSVGWAVARVVGQSAADRDVIDLHKKKEVISHNPPTMDHDYEDGKESSVPTKMPSQYNYVVAIIGHRISGR